MFGTYYHSLDAKGRMAFPAKFRAEFGEKFYVTRWLDDCLAVFSDTEWEKICEKIMSLPIGKSRELQRYLFASAAEVEPDAQGRILLPHNLIESAGLGKETVVVGVFNRAEIWDKAKWNDHLSGINSSDIENIMSELNI